MSLVERLRNRAARLRNHRWRMRPHRSPERHIVIGGTPRSGTTLLRQLLDGHPQVCCGPETSLFLPGRLDLARIAYGYRIPEPELRSMMAASGSQAHFIDLFAARYRSLRQRERWAEKTPLNIHHLGWIRERFPEAHIVHVLRDGRDVVCSLRDYPDKVWAGDHWEDRPRHRPVEWCARRWVTLTGKGLASRSDPRYAEVRYEDLVTDPQATLERLLGQLGLDPLAHDAESGAGGGVFSAAPVAASGISRSSVGRWERDLSSEDQAVVMRVAGARLRELGYLEAEAAPATR